LRRSKGLSAFKGELCLALLPLISLLYSVEHPSILLVTIALFVRLFMTFRTLAILTLVLGLLVVFMGKNHDEIMLEGYNHQGEIEAVETNRDHPRVIVKVKDARVYVYHEMLDTLNVKPGTHIMFEGIMERPRENGYFYGFDYPAYLRAIKIDGLIYAQHVSVLRETFTLQQIPYALEGWLEERLPESAPYVKALILGNTDSIAKTYQDAQQLGIAHLFAVSGMHVGVFALIVSKVLNIVPIAFIRDGLLVVALVSYGFLCGFPPSVVRAVSYFLLMLLNKRLKLGFSNLDGLVIVFSGSLLIHPSIRYHMGFVLSFSVAFALLMFAQSVKSSSKFVQMMGVSCVAFLVTLPLIASMGGYVNLFTPFINIVYVVVLSMVLLPGAYLAILFPFIDSLLAFLHHGFEWTVSLSKSSLYQPLFIFVRPGLAHGMYYLLLLALFATPTLKRRIIHGAVLVVFILGLMFYPYLNPSKSLFMFDVAGDAFLIQDAYHRCNILIDTGDVDPHNNLAIALKQHGVHRLDYVLVSHNHSDHYGGYQSVREHIPIGALVTNHTQGPYEGMVHTCGSANFYIFPLEHPHANENDASMVVYVEFMGRTILFTGDMERPRETTFVATYDVDVDWLKVAHHGSNTSSHDAFLDMTNPKNALVPATRNNRFNHPDVPLIERLESRDIAVIRLDTCGSLRIKKFGDRITKNCAISP